LLATSLTSAMTELLFTGAACDAAMGTLASGSGSTVCSVLCVIGSMILEPAVDGWLTLGPASDARIPSVVFSLFNTSSVDSDFSLEQN